MLFAMDTSTNWASLALLEDNRIISSRAWEIGRQHSVQIFDAALELLSSAEKTMDDISHIGVACGPGSFNGVRVGITVAKTLALVQQIPVVGISTLAAIGRIAAAQLPEKARILTVLEAGRNELYATWYNREWYDITMSQSEDSILLVSIEEIARLAAIEESVTICGEMTPQHREIFQKQLNGNLQILDAEFVRERANGVALLAAQAFAHNAPNAYLTLEPLYVRHPNITISKRHPLPPIAGEEPKV